MAITSKSFMQIPPNKGVLKSQSKALPTKDMTQSKADSSSTTELTQFKSRLNSTFTSKRRNHLPPKAHKAKQIPHACIKSKEDNEPNHIKITSCHIKITSRRLLQANAIIHHSPEATAHSIKKHPLHSSKAEFEQTTTKNQLLPTSASTLLAIFLTCIPTTSCIQFQKLLYQDKLCKFLFHLSYLICKFYFNHSWFFTYHSNCQDDFPIWFYE